MEYSALTLNGLNANSTINKQYCGKNYWMPFNTEAFPHQLY